MDVQVAFQALGDATRRRIIGLLQSGERPAGELAQQFEVSWPTVSRHLAVLKGAGLVTTRRQGRLVLYTLSQQGFAAVAEEMAMMGAEPKRTPARLAASATEQASSVFERCTEVATEMGSDMVGTHHLLLTLLSDADGTARTVLANAGVSFDRARSKAAELFPPEPTKPKRRGQIRFEWACKTVISGGIPGEAIRLGHRYMGTGVQLLALVNEVERSGSASPRPGKAARLLQALDIDLDKMREDLRAEIDAVAPEDPERTELGDVLASLGTNYQMMWEMFVGLESRLERQLASIGNELKAIKSQLPGFGF